MKTGTLLGLVVLLTGCAVPMGTSYHTVGRARFDTSEKRLVWGRALEKFQEHNAIVTLVDYEAGILASGSQPGERVPCRGIDESCESVVGWQFTMSDDGHGLLSVRRGVLGRVYSYSEDLLRPEDKTALDAEADAILATIVGERGQVAPRVKPGGDPATRTAPASEAATPRAPSKPWPNGARCSKNEQCASRKCVMMKCSEE